MKVEGSVGASTGCLRALGEVWRSHVSEPILLRLGPDYTAYLCSTLSNLVTMFGFLYSNEHDISPFETNLMRGLIGLLMVRLYHGMRGVETDYENTQEFRVMCLRNSLVVVQCMMLALSQFYMPQPIFYTLNCVGPIYVFVLDYLLNGISITARQGKGVLLGAAGMIVVANARILAAWWAGSDEANTNSKFEHYHTQSALVSWACGGVFMATSVGWAYAVLLTKKIKQAPALQVS